MQAMNAPRSSQWARCAELGNSTSSLPAMRARISTGIHEFHRVLEAASGHYPARLVAVISSLGAPLVPAIIVAAWPYRGRLRVAKS